MLPANAAWGQPRVPTDPHARAVLFLVARLGRFASADNLAPLMGVESQALDEAIDTLVAAGWLVRSPAGRLELMAYPADIRDDYSLSRTAVFDDLCRAVAADALELARRASDRGDWNTAGDIVDIIGT